MKEAQSTDPGGKAQAEWKDRLAILLGGEAHCHSVNKNALVPNLLIGNALGLRISDSQTIDSREYQRAAPKLPPVRALFSARTATAIHAARIGDSQTNSFPIRRLGTSARRGHLVCVACKFLNRMAVRLALQSRAKRKYGGMSQRHKQNFGAAERRGGGFGETIRDFHFRQKAT